MKDMLMLVFLLGLVATLVVSAISFSLYMLYVYPHRHNNGKKEKLK